MKFKSALFIVFLSSNILLSQEYIKIGDRILTKQKFTSYLEELKEENFNSQVHYNVFERELRNDSIINNMAILVVKGNKTFLTPSYKFLNKPFPSFKIQDFNKAVYSKFNFRNKYTLVCLWSKYVLPSKREIKKLNLLNSNKKFKVVGFFKGTELDRNNRKKIEFPILLNNDKWFYESFGGVNSPKYLIIDGDGIVKYIIPVPWLPDSNTKYSPINMIHKEMLDILSSN